MPRYTLTPKVDDDLDDIAYYTYEEWGYDQSERYITELFNCFDKLAKNPDIGRDASKFAPRLKRFNYKAHSIFYTLNDIEIRIVRILSQRQDFERHFKF